MSQKTLSGSPEDVGLIEYSPSPWASPVIRISLQVEPGTKSVEPFFAARNVIHYNGTVHVYFVALIMQSTVIDSKGYPASVPVFGLSIPLVFL